jgi:DNA replication protein DnaC
VLVDGSITQTKMVATVRNWLDTDRPWLTLCGTVGRGKTMAAAWALVERAGRYVPARELERIFAARYGDELKEQEALISTRFVVVDDIGRERDAEGMTTALLELIDQRRRSGRRTIAITNLSKQEFLRRYQDARLHDRLNESATWGVDTGASMRGGKGG